MNYIFKVISLFLILTFAASCIGLGKRAEKVVDDRKKILQEFKGVSVLKGREAKTVALYIYKGSEKNQYFFSRIDNEKYKLTKIAKYFEDKIVRDDEAIQFLSDKLNVMDEYDVNSISHEFWKQGIDMKIYFNNLDALYFIPNVKRMKNSQWLKHLERLKKIDEQWYYESHQAF